MNKLVRLAWTAVGCLTVLSWAGGAQSDTAQISGFVKDPTGAVVSKANVTILNEPTGLERRAATNEAGYYVVSSLPPGYYSLSVEAAGFKKFVKTQNKLQPNISTTVDVSLDIAENREFHYSGPPVQADTATVAKPVEGSQIEAHWDATLRKNTTRAHQEFIKKYPGSPQAVEARRWIEDPDFAFLITCCLGSKASLGGFIASHPESDWITLAKQYLQCLTEVNLGKIQTCKRFVSARPENPFVVAANASFPVLWLKEEGGTAGVVVRVGEVLFRGLLGRGPRTPEAARKTVFQEVQKELQAEGVAAVLLESAEQVRADKAIRHIIAVDYTEVRDQSVGVSASDLLMASIAGDRRRAIVNFTVSRSADNAVIHSGFHSLSSGSGATNFAEALKGKSGDQTALVAFVLRLMSAELSDPGRITAAVEALRRLRAH